MLNFRVELSVTYTDRILPPCNYCHDPWCVGDKSYLKALLNMFSCDDNSDYAIWNEVFHYWDRKLSWWSRPLLQITIPLRDGPFLGMYF